MAERWTKRSRSTSSRTDATLSGLRSAGTQGIPTKGHHCSKISCFRGYDSLREALPLHFIRIHNTMVYSMTPARDPKQSFFEKHLESIWESLQLRSHLGNFGCEGRHLGGIWDLGIIWEASGKHQGSIWKASGKHLGGIWASGICDLGSIWAGHLGSGRHLGGISGHLGSGKHLGSIWEASGRHLTN